jgi:hypothetical protein
VKTSRFEIRRGRSGKWRFNLIAANGEIVAASQAYTTKAKCLKGIYAVVDAVHLACRRSTSPHSDVHIVDTTKAAT